MGDVADLCGVPGDDVVFVGEFDEYTVAFAVFGEHAVEIVSVLLAVCAFHPQQAPFGGVHGLLDRGVESWVVGQAPWNSTPNKPLSTSVSSHTHRSSH